MDKLIPYTKLSKRARRQLDRARRRDWGGICPVTRKPASSRAYNRRRAQDWKGE